MWGKLHVAPEYLMNMPVPDQTQQVRFKSRMKAKAKSRTPRKVTPRKGLKVHTSSKGVKVTTVGTPKSNKGVKVITAGTPKSSKGVKVITAGTPKSNKGVKVITAGTPKSNKGVKATTAGTPKSNKSKQAFAEDRSFLASTLSKSP